MSRHDRQSDPACAIRHGGGAYRCRQHSFLQKQTGHLHRPISLSNDDWNDLCLRIQGIVTQSIEMAS